MARHLSALRALPIPFDAVICDLWGVLHDGVTPYPDALECLGRLRAEGKTVLLLSNSPNRGHDVVARLVDMGIDPGLFEGPLTAGDVAHAHVAALAPEIRIFHLGPARDEGLRNGLVQSFVSDPEDADIILCSGLIDPEEEDVEWHRPMLQAMADRGQTMVCANPDRLVELGRKLVPCAGALADVYEQLGGSVVWCGKPHQKAYQMAIERLTEIRGKPVPLLRLLAIGDGLFTDIAGAKEQGIDSLFLINGVHRGQVTWNGAGQVGLKGRTGLVPQPTHVARRLVW